MATSTGEAKRIIYDTDMGSDDWLAALLLLSSPLVSLEAITVTGAGLASLEKGVSHALGLAALAGKRDTPVAAGRETPLRGGNAFPEPWRKDTDSLGGLSLPAGGVPSQRSAVETILACSQQGGGRLTLVATGPLTNVAEALQIDASLARRLEMVYVMGGAVYTEGNVQATWPVIPNRTAEWNFYVDPHAAALVLSLAPVTLVGLDATNHAPVTLDFYRRLEGRRKTPVSDFVFGVLTKRLSSIEDGSYCFWDPLAAAVAVDERFTTIEDAPLRVLEEGPDQGRTERFRAGARVRVCRGADLAAFEHFFLGALEPQS
jgi:pyrimidine-specific ribonucleoside hydrolase